MSVLKIPAFRVGLMLALFAVIATSLVAVTEQATRPQIAENERQALLKAISELISSDRYDNDILQDTRTLPPTAALSTTSDTQVFRARKQGQPVAAIFTTVAPNGYSGRVTLLVAIDIDGTLSGVRVISHKETPGLGDKIDVTRSDWIKQFAGLSINNPMSAQWKVKKDGGVFDQFTGATITPRAVVAAIKAALEYFEKNRDALFAN